MTSFCRLMCGAAVVFGAALAPAQAAWEPTRPVEIIVPAGPGGGADQMARVIQGIIAKHRDRPYRSGRTGDWIKIKCIQSESFMIVGYEQSEAARGGIGSLLLAARKGDGWVFHLADGDVYADQAGAGPGPGSPGDDADPTAGRPVHRSLP